MRTAQRAKPKRQTVSLTEDLVGLSKPEKVSIGPRTITLHGAKILGLISKNGRRYTSTAARNAIPLYEGCKVNIDHPDKPRDRRSAHDRGGKVANVHQVPSGDLYGDVILLRRHPLARRVADAVQEGMQDAYAFSHNADGEAHTDAKGFLEIDEITAVRSVDLVADGATNMSLFEQDETDMRKKKASKTVTLRELIEASDHLDDAFRTSLLEMDGDSLDADMPAEPEADWKSHIVNAIGALVSSDSEEDHAKAKQIMAILKPAAAKKEGAAEEGDDEEPDEKDDDDKEEKKEKTEGAKHKTPAGSVTITEAKAKSLCELASVKPSKELLECLCDLSEDRAVAHLKLFKAHTAPAKQSGPRSSSPGSYTEGDERTAKKVKDTKSFTEAITTPDD